MQKVPAIPGPVCVTGAAGFIGSHVVRDLLSQGIHVRATVRDPRNELRVGHLSELAGGLPGRLELFAADLLVPGSFDQAVAGCVAVCHIAAVVRLAARDPQRDIVDPAVLGTDNVFSAVSKAGTVRRMSMTSSVAAVLSTRRPPAGKVFTEADWADDATIATNPYGLAKTTSERRAWEHHAQMSQELRPRLTMVNPAMVFGPVFVRHHVQSSVRVLVEILEGRFPALPALGFGVVDVRDVSQGLIAGLSHDGPSQRHIMSADSLWLLDIARILALDYPGWPIPRHRLPGMFMFPIAVATRRLTATYVRENLNRLDRFDSTKAVRLLGRPLRPVRETLLDTCAALVERSLVKCPRGV